MPDSPTLLFLHGVGSGDREDEWAQVLNQSLASVGYPPLDTVDVIAPKYPHALRGADDHEPLPKVTVEALKREAAVRHRRAFERRTGSLEALLGRHDRGNGWAGGDAVVEIVIGNAQFVQANNYVSDPHVRAQVLNRVLRHLPESGRLLIVGHSLGSVIAADLVRRLPADVEVTGLVTLGSPLANSKFHVDKLRQLLEGPPANLGWWVNFWNVADPVTTHRGVSSIFPWMIDHRVQSPLGLKVHDATTYLKHDLVATAIGFGLFGSRSKELVAAGTGVDIPLDYAETVGLLALRYAHLAKDGLEGDRQDRYTAALRQVQAATLDLIAARNAREARPLPMAVADLAVDLTDATSTAPEPRSVSSLSKAEAVIPLISIATTNVIRPFEIDVPKEQRRRALEDLTLTIEVRREHARLEPFCDDSAPALRQLKLKLESIDRALNYLHRCDLAPTESADHEREQPSSVAVGQQV